MHKFLILIFTLGLVFTSSSLSFAQPPTKATYSVSEVLKTIKGQWRQQYKIIDGSIFYDRRYMQSSKGLVLTIDTSSIHSFNIDPRGRTQYSLNWEEPSGNLQFEEESSKGSWDLKQGNEGVELVIRDAFYSGCPIIVRRIVRINKQQLLVLDLSTGNHYYYTRR